MFSICDTPVRIFDQESVRIPMDRLVTFSPPLRSCKYLELYSETNSIPLSVDYWKLLQLITPNVCQISLKNASIPYPALLHTITATGRLEVNLENVRLSDVNGLGKWNSYGFSVAVDEGTLAFEPEMQETARYRMLWNLIHDKFPAVHQTIFGDPYASWKSLRRGESSKFFTKNATALLRCQTDFTGTTDAELHLVDIKELKPAILFELSLYLKKN
jgi:hypothetical protein